jgi:hypothetical protein
MTSGPRWFTRRSRRRNRTGPESPHAEQRENDLLAYDALLLREVEKDSLLWQAPALALTAQAFLLTIALDSESDPLAVIVSAALGVIVAVLSVQLMAKHRLLMRLDRAHMHFLEERLGLDHLHNREHFYVDGKYGVPDWLQERGAPVRARRFESAKSVFWWGCGLWIFAAANVCIIVLECVGLAS